MYGDTRISKGSCLCQLICYQIKGKLRDIWNCHCNQCLKFHGHFGAYTNIKKQQITITNANKIKWYHSSKKAKRAFCSNCGSSLFWHKIGDHYLSIAAGTLEKPTNLVTIKNIFTEDKGDYYCLSNNI